MLLMVLVALITSNVELQFKDSLEGTKDNSRVKGESEKYRRPEESYSFDVNVLNVEIKLKQ